MNLFMESSPQTIPPAMLEALDRLWTKFLPEIENRMGVLESAARALESGVLSADEREAAHQAAHKLAGVLGTFGLHRGTELARQAELGFSNERPVSAGELSYWVAELRLLIDQRK
jgi:HPt (histidine-containing phosphotransfer) domain-containing protein